MSLTKTDHNEQSLQIDKETKFLLREAFTAMIDNNGMSVSMRNRALQLKRMLEDPDKEDKPAIFQKTHGQMILCPDCAGTRTQRIVPDDRNDDDDFVPCPTCKGEGQLFHIVIRRYYVPTDMHRRKLTK